MFQRLEVVFDIGEGLGRGEKGHLGAAFAAGLADDGERRHSFAVAEFDVVLLAAAPDPQFELARQRIDHRYADAVQAAGDLVGVLVEFSAGMKLGHDDLGRGNAFALMDVGRNAPAVVAHRDGIVRIEDDFDAAGVTRERFVDRVVDDLVDHVMQAGAVIGVADIHARTLANGIEALQHPDRFRAIFNAGRGRGFGARLPGWFSHEVPSRMVESSLRNQRLRLSICAMKTSGRIAQSERRQAFE